MNQQQLDDLHTAVTLLENPSLGARIAELAGAPIQQAIAILPDKAQRGILAATQKAIEAALWVATKTMRNRSNAGVDVANPSNWQHGLAVAITGAAGGAFGLSALLAELPITTTIMMRSIADVARSEGADLDQIETRLECVQVLALGGPPSTKDANEVAYFIAREAMAAAIGRAAAHIAEAGVRKEGAPAIVRLVIAVAERFSISVTEKAAAQMIPIVGAIGGALINTVFIDHFQNIARGHFIIRRLEAEAGADVVKAEYVRIRNARQ